MSSTTETTQQTTSGADTLSITQRIQVTAGTTRYSARVKWFDNAMNYGFATVLDGEHTGKDIFIHQSNILTLGQNVYRTLRTAEYIEFSLVETPDSEHKFLAKDVTGPGACPLMCETNPLVRRRTVKAGAADSGAADNTDQATATPAKPSKKPFVKKPYVSVRGPARKKPQPPGFVENTA